MDGNDAFVAAYEDVIMYLNITDTANVQKLAHSSYGGEDILALFIVICKSLIQP